MNKLFVLFTCLFLSLSVKAQQPAATPTAEPYGKVDMSDLQMTSCDFEKDANAEILFDKALIHSGSGLTMERHIRIKIFNDFGKKNANIRLAYHTEFLAGKGIAGVEGETINLDENGVIVTTPIDKSQIFTEKINKNFSAIVFTFPNVKAGSIIEYKYRSNPPDAWYFQSDLPTRYSEVSIYKMMSIINHILQPFVVAVDDFKENKATRALSNIHSLPDEPYMTARKNNLERVEFDYPTFRWSFITNQLIDLKEFGGGLTEKLSGEDGIIKASARFNSTGEQVAFIFDTVKKCMKWNNNTFFLTSDGIKAAWDKKSGNTGEINLITYHFLRAINIEAYPMIACTRDYGRIIPTIGNPFSFNTAVTYVPIDSSKFYTLDASSKNNLYTTIPYNLLNSYGLCINLDEKKYKFVYLENKSPITQTVFIKAEITAGGKMTGTSEITSDSYNKIEAVKNYQDIGEKKYIDSLLKKGNNISISSFDFENSKDESIPLTQKIAFNMDLTGSDENYIYFNTNLFTLMEDNPFKSEQRFSDINLGYRNNYLVNGIYKIPAGYKVEAIPKSITIIMPDQSIVFKRTVAEDNGTILVRYSVNHKKTIYLMKEYQDIRGFYKKMYELLNEQVILKKG